MRSNAFEELYKILFELSPDGIVTTDIKGTITSVNPAFLKVTELSKEEIVGRHIMRVGTARARDIPKYLKLFSDAVRGKIVKPIDFSFLRKDGTIGLGEGRVGLIKEDDKTVGIQIILRDVTEQKQSNDKLIDSEKKYRNLVDLAPDSIMTLDLKGVITSCNTASTMLSGYSEDELVGKHFSKIGLLPMRGIPKYLKMLINTLREKKRNRLRLRIEIKMEIPVLATFVSVLSKRRAR